MPGWALRQIFGRRSLGGMVNRYICNENSSRLLQISNEHNLLIANAWFPHKRIHMFTWECRGRGLRSLTDYFLIARSLGSRWSI